MKIIKKFKPLGKQINLDLGIVGFDTETTGLTPYSTNLSRKFKYEPCRPFAFSFADSEGNVAYRRWKVDPMTREVIPDVREFEDINNVLKKTKILKVGHNIPYDINFCQRAGFEFSRRVHDTMFMAHIVTGGQEMTYALKPLSKRFLGVDDEDQKDLIDSVNEARRKGKKLGWNIATKEKGFGDEASKADYWLGDPILCQKYAERDAERTLKLYYLWEEEIRNNPNFKKVYERERKLLWVVRAMESRGVRVSPDVVDSLYTEYSDYAKKHFSIVCKSAGRELNLKSPKQMTKLFYVDRGYEAVRFGDPVKGKPYFPSIHPSCNPKLDGEDLLRIAKKYDDTTAKSLLEYKSASQMLSSFLDPYRRFMTQASKDEWVLHPNFKQVKPVTGRFSCSDPNLMQVASESTGRRKADITLRPREALGPRKGCVWYMPDFSQMEVWVFAFLSQEKEMTDTLLAGEDFHGSISKAVWGHLPDYLENKAYYRKRAKLLMFCKLYGGGPGKIAILLESTVEEAKKFEKDYEQRLPGVKRFMDKMINKAEVNGFIVNPFGRTYFLNRKFSYRAVNYLVQGSCADLMKNAMINVDRMLRSRYDGKPQILLTLHDELIIEVPQSYHSLELMKDIVSEMQKDSSVLSVPVPLPIGVKICKDTWNKTIEIPCIEAEWKRRYLNVKDTGKK